MIVPLSTGDTEEAVALLRARPLHNVFLDYLVSAGVLGRAPGFIGARIGERLVAVMMIGPLGGTALEVLDPEAYAPLARTAAETWPRPRHIVGSEDVTAPFWNAYAAHAAPLRWQRRELVSLLRAADLVAQPKPAKLERASERDLEEVVENSAEQHREDLGDDRLAADPPGFRERHRRDLREGRWWVSRERGAIAFQAHVGAHNSAAVQIGGVFVPSERRGRGHGRRGIHALGARLLERHPAVSLYCNEANEIARQLYEGVGFRVVFANRSYLLDEPLVPVSPV